MRAYGAWVRGEFETAVPLARAARVAEDALGITPSGLIERVLANVLYVTGEIEAGLIEGARLIDLAEESDDDSRLTHAYYVASVASSPLGRYDHAHRLIDRARVAGRRTGSPTDLASASVAEGFAARDAESAIGAFDTADRLARSGGNRWMSAFARTEASSLLVHLGRVDDGCQGLAEMVDVWYRAGEWAQQWHTLSRCVIALHRIGQRAVAAEVLGAIEGYPTMGGPPVMTTLRDLAFEARDAVEASLGSARTEELRAEGRRSRLLRSSTEPAMRCAVIRRASDGLMAWAARIAVQARMRWSRWAWRWPLRSAASRPTPSIKLDLRRRRKGRPNRYNPARAQMPPSWTSRPRRSNAARSSHA